MNGELSGISNSAGGLEPGSRSIYRGHSQAGLGENPGSKGAHGQQYLDADSELWKPPLPDDLRWWMTLDDRAQDRWSLGENMEAWSYLSLHGLIVVVRLTAAGLYRERSVYFSHGRAWQAADCGGGFDPGALLGWSQAFDQPFTGSRPARGDGYPTDKSADDFSRRAEAAWKSAVQNEPAVAVSFLSNLLEARRMGVPLILAVPLAEFVQGSALYQLVAFARASLPEKLKMDCRVRIYTSEPGKALSDWKCNLIVIPEDLAPDALAARRDAILLDRRGRDASPGRRVDTGYATAVVDRMGVLPAAIFAFSARLNRTPEVTSSDAVRSIYNLAAVFPPSSFLPAEAAASAELQQDRDGLLQFLWQDARIRPDHMPWDRLIEPSEWQQFSAEALNDVAFCQAETPDGRTFRNGARSALASRRQVDQDKLLTWWSSVPADGRLTEFGQLVETKILTTPEDGAVFVADFRAAQVQLMLDQPGSYDILACVSGSPGWADAIASDVQRLPALAKLAQRSVFWWGLAFKALREYVAAEQLLPDRGECLAVLHGVPFPSELPMEERIASHLLLAEALETNGRGPEAQARIGHLYAIDSSDRKRRLLEETWYVPQWTALRKYFRAPWNWYGDTRDLALSRPELMAGLDVPELLNLAPGTRPLPRTVQDAFDEKMKSQLSQCTSQLRKGRAWLRWRLGSSLGPAEIRACALAWLCDRSGTSVTLEEWKQCCLDLGTLRKDDLDRLVQAASDAPWPLIKMFEEEQLADMAQACPDLGMVAYLAESWGKVPHYGAVAAASRFKALPSKVVSLLSVATIFEKQNWQDFAWEDIQGLYEVAGHRRAAAQKAAAHKVEAAMQSDLTLAQMTCEECGLRDDPYFRNLIARKLSLAGNLSPETLQWLEGYLRPADQPPYQAPKELAASAAKYLAKGFPNLGRFLWPALQVVAAPVVPTDDAKFSLLIRALCEQNPELSLDFGRFLETANEFQSDGEDHPFRQLARAIRELPEQDQNKIGQHGWKAFRQAAVDFRRKLHKIYFLREPASLLELAAVLSTADIGEVAANVARLAGDIREPSSYDDREWWRRLVEASRTCPRRSGMPDPDDRADYVTANLWRGLDVYPAYGARGRVAEVLHAEWESRQFPHTGSEPDPERGRH